ncbi:FAD-binding domain-containing protein [Flammula alnicola]|nr:FAD-binding domain-containing protein [Flammula alnicola]
MGSFTAKRLSLVSALLSLASRASAVRYLGTCKQIERSISPASAVFYPGSSQYAADIFHAYSSSSQNATCSVEPATPQDAAMILKIVGNTRTPYAVKSGGHTTNPGWSSTPGVQIALSRFNGVVYNATAGTARVGTGQKSEEAYHALEPFNVSIAAGRVSGVGVGGFTLGGGYSWLTNQVGVSCDTVVAFEVALPTGKVVTATNTSNADLFFGLKGGGNNFGVVTAITYKVVEQPAVWGGLVVVNGTDNIANLSQAVSQFQDNNTNPKAVIGVTYGFNPSFGGLFVSVFYYYHGPSPPAGTFDQLLAVPAISSSISVTTLTNLVSAFNGPGIAPRALWRSISIQNYTIPVLNEIANQVSIHGATAWNHSAILFTLAVEPLLPDIFSHQPNGPAAYFHTAGNFFAPSIVGISWTDATEDSFFFDLLKTVDVNVRDFAASAAGGLQPVEPPVGILYPNYASYDTPTSLLFGSNLPKLRLIQKKYDPRGVTNLTHGWKFF